MRIATFLTLMAISLTGCEPASLPEVKSVYIQVNPKVSEQYVAKVKLYDKSIRMIILKHCPDAIANTDSDQALKAVNLAATKGLSIKQIGNFHIDREGKSDRLVWNLRSSDAAGLKAFISEQMKVNAEPGDTLVIYTIGHGGGDGTLMRLGQRDKFMTIMAEAAEENNQRVLWWQLSCHAAAKLPPISSLTESQQELFSMIASSPANKVSYFCTQGAQMEKVFVALANNDKSIDPDSDGIITAKEFSAFMNNNVQSGRGDLVFAKDPNHAIFGWCDLANSIPIVNRDGNKAETPKNYIPLPRLK